MTQDRSSLFRIAFLSAVFLACYATAFAWPWSNEERKGMRQIKAGDLSKALQHYRAARLKDPDNPAMDYNVGNVLHLDNKFAEAIAEYSKALQGAEGELAQMTHYNMGNTHYRTQDMEKAIRSYVDALLADPDDQDAKHNLEMALRAMEQQQQQQENKEDKGGEDNEKEEEERESDPNDKQEEQQPEEGEEDRPQEGDLTREQAERILNALNEQEKRDRKDMKEAESRTAVRVDKDW